MNHKKTIWISISLTAFLLAFFSIILLNYFDKSVDNNDCVETTLEESKNDSIGTTLEESENDQKKTINIPEHISNILSKEYMIDKATTQYSVLYGYNNNREMYVFTAPIIEKNGTITQALRNDICGSNEVFFTQNQQFNVSFEKNLINMKNGEKSISLCLDNFTTLEIIYNYESLYGVRNEALKYTDEYGNYMYCMPTYGGLLVEYYIHNSVESDSIDFKLELPSYSYVNDPAGYVNILCKDSTKAAVAFQGMIFEENNIFYGVEAAKIVKENKNIYLKYNIPENISLPCKYVISIDMYSEKMFFDTSTYSAKPKTNFILNNISYFSAQHSDGNERTYMKTNLRSITPKQSELLEQITLSLYAIYAKEEVTLDVYKVKQGWCSWTMNWENHPSYYEKIGEIIVDQPGWYDIDLTDYVKSLIDNGYDGITDNSFVLVARSAEKGEVIFASADNSCAPPYYKVVYKNHD